MHCNLHQTLIKDLFHSNRLPGEQNTDHGEAGSGHLRVVQIGRGQRRPRRGDQQENLARDHQRPELAIQHHQRRVHPTYPVSIHLVVS